jgi:hypothetical protein
MVLKIPDYLKIPKTEMVNKTLSMIGDASTDVRITMPTTTYGEMKWSPSIASKTNCPVDSTYFPFDIQKCNITLTPWGYTDSEVNIQHAIKFTIMYGTTLAGSLP